MDRVLIWASGYNLSLLNRFQASTADRQTLRKIGGALLFSMVWFGAMSALAAWTMTVQAAIGQRLAISAAAFAAAACFVLVFDRCMLFGSDTCSASPRKLSLYAAARLVVIVAIGSLVDVWIMPMLMRDELASEAYMMRENAEAQRFETLNQRYDVAGLKQGLSTANGRLEAAKRANETLPDSITAQLGAARRCFATLPAPQAQGYRAQYRVCLAKRQFAEAARIEYQRSAAQELAQAKADFASKQAAHDNARGEVSSRYEQSREEYGRVYTQANYAVFIHLITTSPGAALKALFLLMIHLVGDLLPFLVKGYYGRSGVGARIMAHRQAEKYEAEAEIAAAGAEHRFQIELNQAMAKATATALAGLELASYLERCAHYRIKVVEPIEQARMALHRTANAARDLDEIEMTNPDVVQLKAELIHRAMVASLNAAARAS